MTLYHPTEPQQFTLRNALLQKSLRPNQLPFQIASEYPIVLSPQGSNFSYCYDHLGQLCSHANLWPRKILNYKSQDQILIGLVGNVATDPQWRGLGHMRHLLNAIEAEAERHGLAALILWSDLSTFYYNLGYQSLGKEFHFHFMRSLGEMQPKTLAKIRSFESQYLSEADLVRLLELRYPLTFEIHRHIDEFRSMLTIPWLDLWIASENGSIVAYALLGKGYDMMGVIHEWGASEMNYLIDLIHAIRLTADLEDCILLAPVTLKNSWYRELILESSTFETLPMALAKFLSPKIMPEELADLFIWGLDSI